MSQWVIEYTIDDDLRIRSTVGMLDNPEEDPGIFATWVAHHTERIDVKRVHVHGWLLQAELRGPLGKRWGSIFKN